VLTDASKGGSVAMLEWLATVTKVWSQHIMAKMLAAAASCDKLGAAKWLRANGAAWPNAFASIRVGYFDDPAECWSLSAVQWAIAAGSGWLNWKCDNYAADKYDMECEKEQATDVLRWAHANGCPCTCGLR
jgi:hypothetical protein